MKKNIFIITCLLITQFILAQVNPGGVAGAARWYKADAGVTTGATMTWADQTANAVNVTQTNALRQPAYNTTSGTINFNPTLTFTNSSSQDLTNTTGNPITGSTAHTVYYIAKATSSISAPRLVVSFSNYPFGGNVNGFGSGLNSTQTTKFSGSNTTVTQATRWVMGVPNLTRTGFNGGATQPIYLSSNGATETISATTTPNFTSTNLAIGSISTGGNYSWQGDISEVIIYPGKHTAADYNRVESYLSVKYGITKANDYIASNGTTTYWNTTTNAGYNNNIAGIGRDDNTGLHQRQSQSIYTGVQPIIGNNSTIGTTNTAGAADFATDSNFMLWGSDTGSDKIATAFVLGGVNARMGKIWKVQETNTVGTVKVAIKKSDFFGTNQNLIVSSDADGIFDASGEISIPMTLETIGGIEYYTCTINFANGQFFTFASYVPAPGGVLGIAAWYKADKDFTGTLWKDQSANAYNLTNPTVTGYLYYMNFNEASYSSASTAYTYSSAATAKANWPVATAATTYYYVAKSNATHNGNVIGIGTNGANTGFQSGQNNPANFIGTNGDTSIPNNTGTAIVVSPPSWDITATNMGSNLVRTGYDGGGATGRNYISANSNAEVTNSTNITPTYSNTSTFRIGASGANTAPWDGGVAEVVVYPGKHIAADYNRVESYLALKYGITKLGNYIASNGTTTYWNATTNSGYTNNIAGIGRDDNGSLHQRQSQSQNIGVHPIIGNNSTIGTTNTAGAGDFATDNNFMVWGSDTGSDEIATAFVLGGVNTRMGKIWKVQETNTVGSVKVAIKKSDFNGTNQNLVTSNDATFDGTDTIIAMTEETIGGVVYYTATADFTNGQFFTFASFLAVLSTDNITKNSENLVFPNPTTGIVTIKNSQNIGQVQIFSIEGKLLKTQTANANEVQVDITALPKGVYMLKTNQGSSKIIKE